MPVRKYGPGLYERRAIKTNNPVNKSLFIMLLIVKEQNIYTLQTRDMTL